MYHVKRFSLKNLLILFLLPVTPLSPPLPAVPVRIPQPDERDPAADPRAPDLDHLGDAVGVAALETLALGLRSARIVLQENG